MRCSLTQAHLLGALFLQRMLTVSQNTKSNLRLGYGDNML